jgi:hypothetical protein
MANTHTTTASMTVKIVANDKGNPPGKLADAELHFSDGPLAGLKLIGFAVWERRSGSGQNVTFPARQYSVNGERRSFALLRPIADVTAPSTRRRPPRTRSCQRRGAARGSTAAPCQSREVDHHGRNESARALVVPALGNRSRHRHTVDHSIRLDAVHATHAANSAD